MFVVSHATLPNPLMIRLSSTTRFSTHSIRSPGALLSAFLILCILPLPCRAHQTETSSESRTAEEGFFLETVQPILRQHCYECHSHQAKDAKGGLMLDSRSGWKTGGDSGPAIVPGRPDESLLIGAVRYEHLEMPPKGQLPEDLVRQLQRWVADGAHDPRAMPPSEQRNAIDPEAGRRHWAFQPLRQTSPPEVNNNRWSRNDVDRFILAQLEQAELRPVSDADAYTWLRRVSLDLAGLPPSAEQILNFAADSSQEAREQVVDGLLDSQTYGERWARHWLDLVGYADQMGTSNNVFARHAWRYRDYVIDAWNNDKAFDQFLREQIAGDLLEYDNVEQRAAGLTATGFLVLGHIEIVEADKAKLLVDIVDQQLNKVGKAFLGMTIECARCHDHKFDPISQRDYYAMAGFFHSTSSVYKTDRGVWSDVNVLDLPETESQQADRARREKTHTERLNAQKSKRSQVVQRTHDLSELLKDSSLSREDRDRLTKERKELSGRSAQLDKVIEHTEFFAPTVPRVHGVRDVDHPEDMRITIRGNPRALGERVPRGFLPVLWNNISASRLTSSPDTTVRQVDILSGQSGRRELAEWLVDSPLTPRVVVNRIWQKLFGEGLVRSVDYFGLPGDRPSHPKLLDYLARRFIREGWSQKRLIRSLVLSRTYGLDSAHNDRAHAADPDNRLLWRMNRVRLDAEALRDTMVFVSGRLKRSAGGPALPLEYPENVFGLDPNVNPPSFAFVKWRPGQEFERTIYLPVIRHAAQPGPAELRNVFDFPQPSQFTGKRAVTAVPTQALFLMNSLVVREHAAALAARIGRHEDPSERLERLWLTVVNRPITGEERQQANKFISETGEQAWSELCHALLAGNEFLMRL